MTTQLYAIITDLTDTSKRIQSEIASVQADWDDRVYDHFSSSVGGRFNTLGSQFYSNTISLSTEIDQELGEIKKLQYSLRYI